MDNVASDPRPEAVRPGGTSERDEVFRALFDASPDAVLVADASGRIVLANKRAEAMFGYRQQQLLGRMVEALLPAGVRQRSVLHAAPCRALHADRPVAPPYTVLARCRDGTEFPAEIRVSFLQTAEGRWEISAVRDVSARTRAEEEQARRLLVEQATRAAAEAALAARNEIVTIMAHDLKNPLTAIGGWTEQLQQALAFSPALPAPQAERATRAAARIAGATTRMRFLLDELTYSVELAQGRALTLMRETTDLVALVKGILDSNATLSDAFSFTLVSSEPQLYGYWDPVALGRVVDNLISNAMKYSLDGGSIQVSLSVDSASVDRYAVLQVQDHGMGIPPDDLPRLFEPFFRGSNVGQRVRGTGIGLFSSKLVVEQHGGSVTVESALNAGTTVTVRVPIGT